MNSKNYGKTAAPVLTLFVMMFFGGMTIFAQNPTLRSNGKIAFTSDRDGNREIYVMEEDGAKQTRITDNTTFDDHPTWSPDGRKIAFVSQRPTGGYSVFQMNGDGTGKTEVTSITLPNFRNKIISWSPDGRQLVISQANGLDIVDTDGANRRFLTFGFDPAWSPDGSKILFAYPRISNSPGYLQTIKPDGTESRLFLANTPYGSVTGYPDWSPDGSRIALVGGDTANQDMFMLSSDGTGQFYVVNECGGLSPQGCGWINSLAWSPDGSRIVYGAYGNLYLVDQYGNDRTVLAFDGANANPSWQPLFPNVSVSGRVTTPGGIGLRNATVSITDSAGVRRTATTSSFGLYSFADIPSGGAFTISVSSRRYRFAPRTITADGNLTNIDFVGLE